MNYRTELIFSALVVATLSGLKLAGLNDTSWLFVSTSFLWYYAAFGALAILWYGLNKVADFVHWVGF